MYFKITDCYWGWKEGNECKYFCVLDKISLKLVIKQEEESAAFESNYMMNNGKIINIKLIRSQNLINIPDA